MSRAEYLYLAAFTALCVAFVPVYFFFGSSEITVPVSAVLFDALRRYLWEGKTGVRLFGWICVGLYVLFFMIIGTSLIQVTAKIVSSARRILIRRLLLLFVFLVSFAPLITYISMAGRGGHYSFWTAVYRYFERWV